MPSEGSFDYVSRPAFVGGRLYFSGELREASGKDLGSEPWYLDFGPGISVGDAVVSEDKSSATFTVSLSASSDETITVKYTTSSVSALASKDYTSKSGTLTFAPGTTTNTISVPILNDKIDEKDETFKVSLVTPATNATIQRGSAIATIKDEDPSPTLSIGDVIVQENKGNAVFTVTLSAASEQTVIVKYATASVSALASKDYTSKSGTLTFAPGTTTKTISVPILNDKIDEKDETFKVSLVTPATNATIKRGSAIGTIKDEDPSPTLSIGDAWVGESDSVWLQRGGVLGAFPPNFTPIRPIPVLVFGDGLDGSAEAFNVSRSAATDAVLAVGIATAKIGDDESPAGAQSNAELLDRSWLAELASSAVSSSQRQPNGLAALELVLSETGWLPPKE